MNSRPTRIHDKIFGGKKKVTDKEKVLSMTKRPQDSLISEKIQVPNFSSVTDPRLDTLSLHCATVLLEK